MPRSSNSRSIYSAPVITISAVRPGRTHTPLEPKLCTSPACRGSTQGLVGAFVKYIILNMFTTSRSALDRPNLKGALEHAAVDQEILPRNVARMRTGDEGA